MRSELFGAFLLFFSNQKTNNFPDSALQGGVCLSCLAMKEWRGASSNVHGCKNVLMYCMYKRKIKKISNSGIRPPNLSFSNYIGAPNPSCANGDADQIRSANYEPDLTSRIFSLFGPLLFLRSEHSMRK